MKCKENMRKVFMGITEKNYNAVLNDMKLHIRSMYIVHATVEHDADDAAGLVAICYVRKGKGILRWGSEDVSLAPGSVYLIPADRHFALRTVGDGACLYGVFTVSGQNGRTLFKDVDTVCVYHCGAEHIRKVFRCFESKYAGDKFLLKSILWSDIARCMETYGLEETEIQVHSDIISSAVALISENANIKLKASDIAHRLGVSVTYLSKKFKREMSVPVGQYIDRVIYEKVCHDLAGTNHSIEQIAAKYGFCDRFYFSKRFKQIFHETPVEFRNRTGGEK